MSDALREISLPERLMAAISSGRAPLGTSAHSGEVGNAATAAPAMKARRLTVNFEPASAKGGNEIMARSFCISGGAARPRAQRILFPPRPRVNDLRAETADSRA